MSVELRTHRSKAFRLVFLTTFALMAFAANSVLARRALGSGDIGPWSFTAIRFMSGAAVLLLLTNPVKAYKAGSWLSAFALLFYGVFFSYTYLLLPTGTGALILFAAVQFTMIGGGLLAGERLTRLQWGGMLLALFGLAFLLGPGVDSPPLGASLLMGVSGLGWGVYSLRGRISTKPSAQTGGNFIRAGFICLVASPFILSAAPESSIAPSGIALAMTSGLLTTGIGFVIWYMALQELSATRAGVVQLTVPLFAALAGALFIGEALTLRFLATATLILIGVGAATVTRRASLSPLVENVGECSALKRHLGLCVEKKAN